MHKWNSQLWHEEYPVGTYIMHYADALRQDIGSVYVRRDAGRMESTFYRYWNWTGIVLRYGCAFIGAVYRIVIRARARAACIQ